ncbi:uncharacterized protein FMAN_14580 [Fusarium mangiferae]|uniref:PFL domain-containing protein n=1 Tax=Fusarium mangiferae TaxID=192010 RepID=A0A1L7UEU0_FUSMA|nr:uncharacterized protein FMAN_14580 [Fusarium mangiferae]CVL07702.1 uncharacterized protein FMAN_14580 [Fusarium mangiferae]
MSQGRYIGGDAPKDRFLSLLGRTFSHWADGWMDKPNFPRLPALTDFYDTEEDKAKVMSEPVPVRQGLANPKTLTLSLSDPESKTARFNDLLRIDPKELIVGVIPGFTPGHGKEVLPYLSKEETIEAWLEGSLNEWSASGLVVPDQERLVQKGLGELHSELQVKIDNASQVKEKSFFCSGLLSIKGVQGYLRSWTILTQNAAAHASNEDYKANMEDISKRLSHPVDYPPRDFQDAVQLVFSVHCCLHLVGESTALGRLDLILWSFLEKDSISLGRANEIVDCLWLKIGENTFVNRAFVYNHGGGINQSVQQVTVGGYKDIKFVITPDIRNFEGYVGDGAPRGASADGRRNGISIASDLSPVPATQDLLPNPALKDIYQAMESYISNAVAYGLPNASLVDINIDETFPLEDLKEFVKRYAQGHKAVKYLEKYNLLRVRMGEWTEFYATMFPEHQGQHQRRRYFEP